MLYAHRWVFTHFKILYLKIIHFCLQTKGKMLWWDQLRYAFTYLMFLRQLSYLISLELSQLWSIIPIFLSEIRISRVSCLIFEIRQASKLSASFSVRTYLCLMWNCFFPPNVTAVQINSQLLTFFSSTFRTPKQSLSSFQFKMLRK